MIGKRVTLPKGKVAVDIGPSSYIRAVGDTPIVTERIRTMQCEDGTITYVLASVIDALPTTIRRDSFGYRPNT